MTTDNGLEFAGSFEALCRSSGIVHRHITVGNSRANGQVERTIRTIKDIVRKCLSDHSDSFWSDHIPTALMAQRFTRHRKLGFPPFTLITGDSPLPPSYLLEDPPEEGTPSPEAYLDWVASRISNFRAKAQNRLRGAPQIPLRDQLETLFFFEVGSYVLRRSRALGKLAPKRDGPYRVTAVAG